MKTAHRQLLDVDYGDEGRNGGHVIQEGFFFI